MTLFGDHIFPCGASWRLPKKDNFGPWDIGLKIISSAYRLNHLSMGLLNAWRGTSFSPIKTVLVSRLPFVNNYVVTNEKFPSGWAALDFCSNFNIFTLTVGFNNDDSCCQSQELKKSIKDMHLASISRITVNKQFLCHSDFSNF